jgi:hypothetical protein
MTSISALPSFNLPSALTSAQSGLANSGQRLAEDAQQIANPDSSSVTAALVDSTQTLLQAQAAAAILKTADQLTGTLLDTFA